MQDCLIESLPSETGHIGVITLNAPKALNALNLNMIEHITQALETWRYDDTQAIVLRGAGDKAFCAGGDIRALYDAMQARDPNSQVNEFPQTFFAKEYALDYAIHTYPKPIIAWGHGHILGGGLGLFAGASHKVVTEKARIAMPEISIGLYPDVGASWFLPRMPGYTGWFLALTGAPLNQADARFVGLGDYAISHQSYDSMLASLQASDLTQTSVHDALQALVNGDLLSEPSLMQQSLPLFERYLKTPKLEDKVQALLSSEVDEKWWQKAVTNLQLGCPTSAALTEALFHKLQHSSLKEALETEWRVSVQCCLHRDFQEGVRALIVDKDQSPNWQYKTISEVPHDYVQTHFTLPQGVEPLSL